ASRKACLAEVRPSSRNGAGRFFSAAGYAGFASRSQKNRPPPPATSFRPSGAGRSSPVRATAIEAAMGAVPRQERTDAMLLCGNFTTTDHGFTGEIRFFGKREQVVLR